MTSKERAEKRKLANGLDVVMQIGKDGITDAVCNTAKQVLDKRELIKINVLENSGLDTKEIANELANTLNADVVQVIGKKFVLYKENKDKKKK